MTAQITYSFFDNGRNICIAVCLAIAANVILDYQFTLFQNSSFFISESLLFSTYWLLYFPFVWFFVRQVRSKRLVEKGSLAAMMILVHQLLYPAIVWLISKVFFSHTFNYWQTFNFGLSAYFIKTALIYVFLSAFFSATKNKKEEKRFLRFIWVSDAQNRKINLATEDILYFSANSPYINIHHSSKRYLNSDTLKSIESQLDPEVFVRIHKSCVVNISKVKSKQSRQNGDYDITLVNSDVLRVSRSYAKKFNSAYR